MIPNRLWLGTLVLSMFGCGNQTGPENVVIPAPAVAETPLKETEVVAAVALQKDDVPPPKSGSADKKEPMAPAPIADRFASAEAAKLLAQILGPSAVRERLPLNGYQEPQSSAPSLRLDLPLATAVVNAARLPAPVPVLGRPTALAERVPTDLAPAVLVGPERLVLPVDDRTKIDALDVKQRTALSTLARPSTDRVSFDDPTAEFTAQSIVANKLPERSVQAPFVKVNLPDPFENAEVVKFKMTLQDDPATVIGIQPVPKP